MVDRKRKRKTESVKLFNSINCRSLQSDGFIFTEILQCKVLHVKYLFFNGNSLSMQFSKTCELDCFFCMCEARRILSEKTRQLAGAGRFCHCEKWIFNSAQYPLDHNHLWWLGHHFMETVNICKLFVMLPQPQTSLLNRAGNIRTYDVKT